eukprot:3799613-Rhodomonas_salina.4
MQAVTDRRSAPQRSVSYNIAHICVVLLWKPDRRRHVVREPPPVFDPRLDPVWTQILEGSCRPGKHQHQHHQSPALLCIRPRGQGNVSSVLQRIDSLSLSYAAYTDLPSPRQQIVRHALNSHSFGSSDGFGDASATACAVMLRISASPSFGNRAAMLARNRSRTGFCRSSVWTWQQRTSSQH